jgi:hypothetical protein
MTNDPRLTTILLKTAAPASHQHALAIGRHARSLPQPPPRRPRLAGEQRRSPLGMHWSYRTKESITHGFQPAARMEEGHQTIDDVVWRSLFRLCDTL